MRCKVTILLLGICICLPSLSFSYDIVKIRNGGKIEGIVKFSGSSIPRDKTFNSTEGSCGRELRTEKYLINKDNKIKNTVIFIKGIDYGKAIPDAAVNVNQLKCSFVPHVSIGFKGNKFTVKNEDPVLHTLHVYASISGKTAYSIAIPEKGAEVTKNLTKTGLMELNCDCHPWMLGYVYVFDHPYAAISDENGEFVIENIPPGTYTIEAWHEALGTVDLEDVKVESGKTTAINLQYTWEVKLY